MLFIQQNILAIYDGEVISVWNISSKVPYFVQKFIYHPLCFAISPDGKRIVMSGIDKQLCFYDLESGEVLFKKRVNKRLSKIRFTIDDQFVIVSDRSGDVYRFPNIDTDVDDGGEILLGHVSMVTDMILSEDDKYIITADRDEKIRVTNYPETHVIERFLLQHEDYVSSIYIPSFNSEMLLSAGGDDQMLIWNWTTGELMANIPFPQDLTTEALDVLKIIEVKEHQLIVLFFEKFASAIALTFDSNARCFTPAVQIWKFPDYPVDASSDDNGNIWIQYYEKEPSIAVFEYGNADLAEKSIDLSTLNGSVGSVKGKVDDINLFRAKHELHKKETTEEYEEGKKKYKKHFE